jgi:hypothetical protein
MNPLARQRCFIHSWREAAVRCPSCQRFYCRECATEHDGRLLCAQCLAAITSAAAAGADQRRPLLAIMGWSLAATAGLLFTWLVFYYLGAALARAPFNFHTG